MKNKIDSVVIVTNRYASIATLRYVDGKDDIILSSGNKNILYTLIEKHIKKVYSV